MEAGENDGLQGNLLCLVVGIACVSADHLLMPVGASLLQGLWGCCTFTHFLSLFPQLCVLSLAFLVQSTVTTCAVVPILQNQQGQDGPGRVQGASKTGDPPAGFLQVY